MGCIWSHIRNRFFQSKRNKDNNNDVENVIKETKASNNSECSVSEFGIDENESKGEIKEQKRPPLSSFDEAIEECLNAAESLEKLQHPNKSRPRRSNVRRSTRKTRNHSDQVNDKQSNESLDDFGANGEGEKPNSPQFPALSMFSARIEEVTRPLSPSSPVSNQQSFNFNQTPNETTPEPSNDQQADQTLNIIDRTKKIGNPVFTPALFAELKKRQNALNSNEEKVQNEDPVHNNDNNENDT